MSRVPEIPAERHKSKTSEVICIPRQRSISTFGSPIGQIAHLHDSVGNQVVQSSLRSITSQAKIEVRRTSDKHDLAIEAFEGGRYQENNIVTIYNEVTEQNPCLGCPGYCCWQNIINLCGCDVWAIAANLNLKPADFVAFAELNDENPYNFKLDSSDRAYCLALRMREMPHGSRRCIFALDLPNDQVRCGIYPFRPIACRAYPLAFIEEEVMVKPWALCPEDAWNATQVDLAYWREELGRHDMEFSIYACIVGSWNKMAMNKPKLGKLNFVPFLDFLMDIYSNLEPIRREMPAEAWPEIWKQWRCYTARGVNPLLVKSNGTARTASWVWWLESIRKVLTTASQSIRLQSIEMEKTCEEIVL